MPEVQGRQSVEQSECFHRQKLTTAEVCAIITIVRSQQPIHKRSVRSYQMTSEPSAPQVAANEFEHGSQPVAADCVSCGSLATLVSPLTWVEVGSRITGLIRLATFTIRSYQGAYQVVQTPVGFMNAPETLGCNYEWVMPSVGRM